jgi:hypothetical protein
VGEGKDEAAGGQLRVQSNLDTVDKSAENKLFLQENKS